MENKNIGNIKGDIEVIKDKDKILAIIIRKDFYMDGVNFFTPGDFPKQLGFISKKVANKSNLTLIKL